MMSDVRRLADDAVRRPVAGRKLWRGVDLAKSSNWIVPISEAVIRALECSSEAWGQHSNTERPELMSRLRGNVAADCLDSVNRELRHGRGFVVLRGLPVESYTVSEMAAMYMVIGTYFGSVMPQDSSGTLIGHIENLNGSGNARGRTRGYMTSEALRPHTDASDVVSLLCVRKAKCGGLSSIVSAMALYNALLVEHPEYLDVLHQGFFELSVMGPSRTVQVTSTRTQIFSWKGSEFRCSFRPGAIERASAMRGEPLSAFEKAAIDCVCATAMSSHLRLDMELEPGDIQLLDNHSLLHARTSFQDHDDAQQKRLLLRMWIGLEH